MKRWPKDTIAAGRRHTVGLKSDGTMVAVGDNEYGQCDVGGWSGIQLPGN
ncbi:RCC1-like domain-containing protein [Paenibacillus radicis (ex Xue et al. 2023)]|uniref:RCC1 domain-containing protein n=1 Tax=Paenibacillus radicis (ex Xue et al. 2023) TaxID=2972489 RepID=A0ABT1YG42_9BACL|nr:RCC1 domain-containing protein [Paenibacillus radicis (ex Xue et al. 2023)]MCR8632170.1 RCC1 domain-containing protein [Paenibacillus radicis (ex Xue et al. 2023)]